MSKTMKPTMKELYSIEYSTSEDMTNEEVLWSLHSIAMNSILDTLEEKELAGKNLRLVVEEYIEE